MLPDADTVDAWKATYLAVWDASIDDLDPEPAYRTERRAVLERTFDQLSELIRSRD